MACNAIGLLLWASSDRTTDFSGRLLAVEPQPDLGGSGATVDKKMSGPGTTPRPLPSFLEIATRTGTDKVRGPHALQVCRDDPTDTGTCRYRSAINPSCRPGAQHFYHTIYDKYFQQYISPQNTKEPFQFVEIGYFNGRGFDAYTDYIVPNAPSRTELHSIEISCLEKGPRSEGKWPWGNFAAINKNYPALLASNRLHCADASDYDVLQDIYLNKMNHKHDVEYSSGKSSPAAPPPIKIVIDDASHLSDHMAKSLFYWFPRIAPGGILVIEDIQPSTQTNSFRVHVLSQLMRDLHYCGLDDHLGYPDNVCFPTIQPLLQGIHCEMHICVLIRNDHPTTGHLLTKEQSLPPAHALENSQQCLYTDRTSELLPHMTKILADKDIHP
jgi:hypothetical protein